MGTGEGAGGVQNLGETRTILKMVKIPGTALLSVGVPRPHIGGTRGTGAGQEANHGVIGTILKMVTLHQNGTVAPTPPGLRSNVEGPGAGGTSVGAEGVTVPSLVHQGT